MQIIRLGLVLIIQVAPDRRFNYGIVFIRWVFCIVCRGRSECKHQEFSTIKQATLAQHLGQWTRIVFF